MNPQPKTVVIVAPQVSTNTDETTGATFDTKGFDYCIIDVMIGEIDSTNNNPSALHVGEANVTTITSMTDISGCVGDTDFNIPGTSNTNQHDVRFNIDLEGRKRYLACEMQADGVTGNNAMIAHLFKGDEAPISASEQGVDAVVSV